VWESVIVGLILTLLLSITSIPAAVMVYKKAIGSLGSGKDTSRDISYNKMFYKSTNKITF